MLDVWGYEGSNANCQFEKNQFAKHKFKKNGRLRIHNYSLLVLDVYCINGPKCPLRLEALYIDATNLVAGEHLISPKLG